MPKENLLPEDNPDTYLIESSAPDVRAFEQKTRNDIEFQKKELRAMVGEQYLDLISAADAIITMSQSAQAIQTNFGRMQVACDVESIKMNAKSTLQKRDEENNRTHIDTKRRYVYVIAALVKSLADVPEQIWHALEYHRYLHASRLYTLAKQVHEYLEEEKKKSIIDIEVAFPVIQRQWDAVSAFGPHIIQRSIHYLRVSEQSSEHIAEVIVGLMLLDGLSYQHSVVKLLEMRSSIIQDVIHSYNKSADKHRVTHQLREITLIIKRTLQQIYDIFYSKEGGHHATLIESYFTSFKKTFLIPSKSSHGNETPSQSAITRLFSPSSNVHLMVRYLPESIQSYVPDFDPSPALLPTDVQKLTQSWLEQVETMMREKMPETLKSINSQHELIHIRTKLWDLLDQDENTKEIKNNTWQKTILNLLETRYSLWDRLFRDPVNNQSRLLIDRALAQLSDQPESIVWSALVVKSQQQTRKDFSVTVNIWPGANTNKQHSAFALPNFSSPNEIQNFKASLKETASDRTDLLCKLQDSFDTSLAEVRKDVQSHLVHFDHQNFHVKSDTEMIKAYCQDKCYQTVVQYSVNLQILIDRVREWTDNKTKNELSIFIGRLARSIALLSKELPKVLSLSAETSPLFELRSSINKDPKYTEIQNILINTYHQAHTTWIDWLEKEFAQKVKMILSKTKWNDQCAAISVWENLEEDIKLPTQSSNAVVRSIFYVCEEIQCINSTILDQVIMTRLRQQLNNGMTQVYNTFLSNLEMLEITENGSLQLLFDYLFLNMVLLQDGKRSDTANKIIEKLQDQIDPINWASYESHLKPCVNRFYIKQSLLFGVLTSASNETYERARKMMSSQQQGQYNVLPLASQATRFTLLPIGHLTSSSVRAR